MIVTNDAQAQALFGISIAEFRQMVKPLFLLLYDRNLHSLTITKSGTQAEVSAYKDYRRGKKRK